MIVYNVTIKVDPSIAEKWLTWLTKEHIHDVIRTGCFTHASIHKLIDIDESDGVTYAVQYHTAEKHLYEQYLKEHAEEMRKIGIEKWGDKFIAFRSVMEVVY